MRPFAGAMIVVLAGMALCGCATSIHGKVVDASGQPVSRTVVKAHGYLGGMITGETPFNVQTVTDEQGRFFMELPGSPTNIDVLSSDGKRKASLQTPSRFQENVILVK